MKLKRKAASCSAVTTTINPIAAHAPTPLFNRQTPTIPTRDPTPIVMLIAISTGENVPETKCAHPSRNNQISNHYHQPDTKHGSAAHSPIWTIAPQAQPQSKAARSARCAVSFRATPAQPPAALEKSQPSTKSTRVYPSSSAVTSQKSRMLSDSVDKANPCPTALEPKGARNSKAPPR
jgi:hypothetical protein